MGLLVAIFFGSCWIFILAICLGFQNVEGILIFIGIFWFVFIVGGIAKGCIDSSKEELDKLDDLQLISFEAGKDKALSIINKLQWTPTGSMQSREKRYVAFRYSPNNIEDFDWLVKYISHSGCWAKILADDWVYNKYAFEQITNDPYAIMATYIGDSLFKCRKVNADYTTTEIVRIPNNEQENKRIIESRYSKYEDLSVSSKSNVMDTQGDVVVNAAKQLMAQYQHIINNNKEDQAANTKSTSNISENTQDIARAIEILESQKWEKLSILDKGRTQYVCRKEFAPNPHDFKWVVGFLSGIGTPENPKSPHSYMVSNLNGIEYKSIKVNKYFEGTVIYKYEVAVGTHEDVTPLPPMAKLSILRTKYLVEERFKKDPVMQYNLQLLKEKEAELKEKKEEYLKMRNWDNDDVMISLSASSTLDIEEYKEKIEDLKDEIEDLKDEIEELKNELEEIKEEIEAEVEDEG